MIRFVLALLLLPFAVQAEPVRIRSGEHDTFSRLVLSIGVETGWSIEPEDDGFQLILRGRSDGFDTSNIFDRIPRDRLASVAQSMPDTLQLQTNCPCEFDAFLWRPGELVIDILDGAAPGLAEDQPSVEGSDPAVPPSVETPVVMTQHNDETTQGLRLPNMFNAAPPQGHEATARSPEQTQVQVESDLAATETALAEGISRAASQGFLAPVEPVQSDPPEGDIVSTPSSEVPLAEIDVVLPSGPGIGISTAMDRELNQLGAALGRSIADQCLHEDLFQLDAWGDDRDFHEQAAEFAEALAGEFGEEPVDAQNQLAQLYIHFGFGVEARSVLAADASASQLRTVLYELAGIVDDYQGSYTLISSQSGCDTSGAMWAFLVDPYDVDEEVRNRLIQQFFGLPQPLRSQLSPRLARRFLEVGDPDAANRLLRAAENSDSETTHDVQSAHALVSEGFEDPNAAAELLSQQANENARTTPESLIRLVDLDLAQGIAPTEADLLLAAAMRQEHRGTPIQTELEDAEAAGRIALGEYQIAMDILAGREDDAAATLTDHAYSNLAATADAGTFLGFAYGNLPETLTAQTENDLAARLIRLGFFERADVVLLGPAEQEAAAERRFLRAEAAIGIGNYDDAINALLGMNDEPARVLRARAYEGLGEHRAALAALTVDQAASSPTMQFRANAWERLSIESDDVLSTFAEVVLTPANTDPIETLADRRDVLEQSQDSRQAVQDLLLRFDGTSPVE